MATNNVRGRSVKIPFSSLPEKAKDGFSEDQLSYIDEFTFYWFADNDIECWYAGECLATFNGNAWKADEVETKLHEIDPCGFGSLALLPIKD